MKRYCEAMTQLRMSEPGRNLVLTIPERNDRERARTAKIALRRFVLVAAVLIAMMIGAAAVAGQQGIQDWFSWQWRAVFRQPMSMEQMQAINSMTQVIGQSVTADGVTV